MSNLKFMLIAVLSVMAALSSGCDEYEREQMREAADDVGSATGHVGNAADSALDRARSGTADALRNLGDKVDAHNDRINQEADQNQ
ncbi:MAG: hypothetical protein MK089_06185 [Phycisphaerales bacterium]|nr:hypothetical protein [Phycisphaerales bacterium]